MAAASIHRVVQRQVLLGIGLYIASLKEASHPAHHCQDPNSTVAGLLKKFKTHTVGLP